MAKAKLNFDENALDKTSGVYDLYSRLYEGMRAASLVDAPSFVDPPVTPEGSIDVSAINAELADYSQIVTKNSAYLFANSIVSVIGTGGGGGEGPGIGFVSRNGDTMAGSFGALYGFQAGANNTLILEAAIDAFNKSWINITGNLSVSEDATIEGKLNVSDNGIYFGGSQTIYYDRDILKITAPKIAIDGETVLTGSLKIGDVMLTENGVSFGQYDFYHSGNSNKSNVDWTMNNANVHGTLSALGTSEFSGNLKSTGGFEFLVDGSKLLYSDVSNKSPYVAMSSDLTIVGDHGVKVNDAYIVKVKTGTTNVVSFSAPGMVMNLGDREGNKLTQYISLQTGIRNYNGAYEMISQYGDANFPGSFKAGCSNSGPTVIHTFSNDNHHGVVIPEELRFDSHNGPSLFSSGTSMSGTIPYSHLVNNVEQTDHIEWTAKYVASTSLFQDLSKAWSATLEHDTQADFFAFTKPVEAFRFLIKSEKYKTCLAENTLFFDDGKFIEGVKDGMRYTGNSYFDGNLGSKEFAAGYSGYGWGIRGDATTGGTVATFDEVVVRKKMRMYELEVEKAEVTSGSLWISDSCSGDEVRVL